MPWCEECDRLVEDEELTEDGECPTCGTGWPSRAQARPVVLQADARGHGHLSRLAHYQGITWLIHHA